MILTTLINGQRETRELSDGTYLIGRGESCRIRFDLPEVSDRHAVLTVRDGRATLEDLHSSNGTFVNEEPIDRAVVLDGGHVVRIGSGMFRISEAPPEEERPPEEAPPAVSMPAADEPIEKADPLRELRRSVQNQIQQELLNRLDMKRLTLQGVDREGLEDTAREKIRAIIDEVIANDRLPAGIDPVRLEEDVFNEAMRLGPLEELLTDE